MHIEQDNTQLKLGCLNPNQYKYLPDEAVECTKLICKFTGKVEVYLSHECLFFFFSLAKETVFHNHSSFSVLSFSVDKDCM